MFQDATTDETNNAVENVIEDTRELVDELSEDTQQLVEDIGEGTKELVEDIGEGTKEFVETLGEETGRSLGDTFRIFEFFERDWQALFNTVITKAASSLVILLVFFVIYFVLSRLSGFVLQRFKLTRERKIIEPIKRGLRYTLGILAIIALMLQYGVSTEITGAVARGVLIGFGFYIAWLIMNRVLASNLSKRGLDASLTQLFTNISSVIIFIFGTTTVLSQFGINVFSIVTALGVVGIAVGFAAQETLSNFIAGITLLIERPFRIGEWIKEGDLVGQVQGINLRTTRLKTRDNEIVVIPNATMTTSDIINLSGGGPLRIRIGIGIAYKESTKRAKELLLPLLKEHPLTLETPEAKVRVIELADSSVNLEMVYWLAPENIAHEPDITYALLEDAKITLDDAGIEIPFPHMQLFLDEAKGLEGMLNK